MGAIKARLPLVFFTVAAAVLTLAAGLMLFSTFMFYDDEGYVLFSLKNFVEHGHLYGQVYSQYGPFPFVLYEALHFLGLPLTHTAGRLLTLALWSATAVWSAGIVWRTTRSVTTAIAVLSAVFVYLWIMVSEPTHPGGLIALLTAVLASLGSTWLVTGKNTRWAALAGVGCAILVLTKINVGVFASLSVAAFLLLHSQNDRVRRWSPWILAAGFAALPFLLMRSLLDTPWVQTYAIVFALSAVPAVFAASLGGERRFGPREWTAAIVAGAGLALVVLAVIFVRGTSWSELLEGVVFGPLRQPGHFSLVFHWPVAAKMIAIASGAFFFAALFARHGAARVTMDETIAWLRLVAAAAHVAFILGFPDRNPNVAVFSYCAPCLWLFLWPLGNGHRSIPVAQAWIGLLFLGQFLHAYPVPGSQVGWGTFLILPIVAIGAWDAIGWLAAQHAVTNQRARLISWAVRFSLVAFAVVVTGRLAQIGGRYFQNHDLGLNGAEALRLPIARTSVYRLLTLNALAHSDMVFSLPGMFSFNLWTGLPAPTLANVTHWFSLLSVPRQQAIIDSLEAHPRACVIIQKDHLQFLHDHNLTTSGRLYDYVTQTFKPAFEIDGFQFCVRKGRTIAPLSTAEIFQQRPSRPRTGDAPDTLLKLELLLSRGQQIGSVEIAALDDDHAPAPLRLNESDAHVETIPLNLRGEPIGVSTTQHFPFALRGVTLVSLYFDRGRQPFTPDRTLIVVRDPAGAELALVRLRP